MNRKSRFLLAAAAMLLGSRWMMAQLDEHQLLPIDDPAINYTHGAVENRITVLQRKLASGEVRLKSDFDHGYLEAVLQALDVPVSSQVLVFSKTSFQAPKIGPRMPRAVYHSDDVSVGWVRGGDVIELAAVDPRQGTVFYTLDQGDSDHPAIVRRTECMQCHIGASTSGVPGLVVRSTHVDRSGAQILTAQAYITDHRSPLEHRWGGWYVTGRTGTQHMGNKFSANPDDADEMDLSEGINVNDLSPYFSTQAYLRPDSDIVSLMVLEHQTRMVNLLTRVGWESRLGQPIDATVDELVKYMLFVDETPLKAPIDGISEYAQKFSQQGPRDRRGRSLRDFDLKTRMFRYPCSFLIYSAQFDALPDTARARVYGRLYEALNGKLAYATPSAADRQAILEILKDTKVGLPGEWK